MRLILTVMVCALLIAGCASDQAYKSYSDAYAAYARQTVTQAKACEINTADNVTLPKGFNLVCYQGNSSNQIAPPQQIKDSEWVGSVQSLVSSIGTVGSIMAAGSVIKGVTRSVGENAGHNTTGSYNPVDNSNQGNPINNSNQGNPTDSHNVDNHTITPAPVVVTPVVTGP